MIIEFSGALINLDKITYGMVQKYELGGQWRWRFIIYFGEGKDLRWNNFKTEDEARAKKDAFLEAVNKLTYVIQEI